jgi:hypothetical protein
MTEDGLDIEDDFVGKTCQIQVIHNRVGEKTYANIGAIIPAPPGTEMEVFDYVRVKDRDTDSDLPF